MTTVYVLTLKTPLEGSEVLGCYGSYEAASKGLDNFLDTCNPIGLSRSQRLLIVPYVLREVN